MTVVQIKQGTLNNWGKGFKESIEEQFIVQSILDHSGPLLHRKARVVWNVMDNKLSFFPYPMVF